MFLLVSSRRKRISLMMLFDVTPGPITPDPVSLITLEVIAVVCFAIFAAGVVGILYLLRRRRRNESLLCHRRVIAN